MRTLAWMVLVAACEQVDPSASPFQPVAPETAQAGDPVVPAEAFTEEKPLKMSFDGTSMHVESGPADVVAAANEANEKAPTEGSAVKAEGSMASLLSAALEADDPATEGAQPPPNPSYNAGAAAVTGLTSSMTSSPPVADPTQVSGGWAVRLVKTVRDAQPPRAIIGLPNGKEIVVTPGTMIPEEGLVVVAIGPDKVQLSQVKPQGDHANITSFTLQAMY